MRQQTPYYIVKLAHVLESKKELNKQYSMRSLAKKIGVDPGTLSRILKSERIPSMQLAQQIAAILNFDSEETKLFLDSLAQQKWSHQPENTAAQASYEVELEHYRFLSDWIHYAILELTFTHDFRYNNEWMAMRLNRSTKDVESAVKRLISLGLAKEDQGSLIKTNSRLTTSHKHKTTQPLKNLQKDLLQNALDCIDSVDFKDRASVSMTMAINVGNIEKAKSYFVEFSEKMCDLLEEGEQTEVYNLIINLSPLTKLLDTKVVQ